MTMGLEPEFALSGEVVAEAVSMGRAGAASVAGAPSFGV